MSETKPKISILMPVYNRADLVGESIQSMLNQSYSNFELIIYNDGSDDSTGKVLKSFAVRDNRIKLLGDRINRGCAYSRNIMLDNCKTDIACWHDSDDVANIYRLQVQVASILSGKHIVVTGFKWMHNMEKGDRTNPNPPQTKPKNIAHASAMFLMNDVLKVDLKYSGGGSDAEWMVRMTDKFGPYTVIQRAYYFIRKHRNRIGMWKRNSRINPEWSKRMSKYGK